MASSTMNGSAVSPMSSHVLNTTGRTIIITGTFLETSSLTIGYLHIGNSKTKIIIIIGGTHSSSVHGSNTRTTNSHFTRTTNNSLSGYSSRNSSGHFWLSFVYFSIHWVNLDPTRMVKLLVSKQGIQEIFRNILFTTRITNCIHSIHTVSSKLRRLT